MAIGFVLPPEIVPNSTSTDVIGDGLSYMAYGNAAFATVISILIIICESANSDNISVAVLYEIFHDSSHYHIRKTSYIYGSSIYRLFMSIGALDEMFELYLDGLFGRSRGDTFNSETNDAPSERHVRTNSFVNVPQFPYAQTGILSQLAV